MRIAGIDYSMTSPAICTHFGEIWDYHNCQFYFLTKTKKLACKHLDGRIKGTLIKDYKCSEERYKNISQWAASKILLFDGVMLEGYAYGATGRVFDVAENTGILKYKLWGSGTEYEVVSPSQVKKFATGSGAATKDKMHEAWMDETGINLHEELTPKRERVGNPVSDVVDAYFICKFLFYNPTDKMKIILSCH